MDRVCLGMMLSRFSKEGDGGVDGWLLAGRDLFLGSLFAFVVVSFFCFV